MHLHVEFDTGHARDIPVSNYASLVVTEPGHDAVALSGLTCLFLTNDAGETRVGDGTAEDVARSVGWVTPAERQQLQDTIGRLESELEHARNAVQSLQALRPQDIVSTQSGDEGMARQQMAVQVEQDAREAAELEIERSPDAVWASDAPAAPVGGFAPYGSVG